MYPQHPIPQFYPPMFYTPPQIAHENPYDPSPLTAAFLRTPPILSSPFSVTIPSHMLVINRQEEFKAKARVMRAAKWFQSWQRFTDDVYADVRRVWHGRAAQRFIVVGLGDWQDLSVLAQMVALRYMRKLDSGVPNQEFRSYDEKSSLTMTQYLDRKLGITAIATNLDFGKSIPLFYAHLRVYIPYAGPSIFHNLLASAILSGPMGLHHLHVILIPKSYLADRSSFGILSKPWERSACALAVSKCQTYETPVDFPHDGSDDEIAVLGRSNNGLVHLVWSQQASAAVHAMWHGLS